MGHSAGGWLARAYTADPKYYEEERAAAPAAVAAAEAGQADSAAGKAAAGTAGADAPAADSSPVASVDNAPAATGAGKLLAAFSRLLPGSGGGGARPVVSGGGSSQAGRPPRPNPTVRSIVTLGTPQRPPPPGKGVRDMTGGALGWVDRTYPGAFFADQGVTYVCVAGRSVRGNSNASRRQQQQQQGDGAAASPSRGSAAAGAGSGSGSSRRSPPEYAAGSYVQVCGEGEGVEGDAVVPVASAHLPGARVNLLLDGVWHSMSRLGTYGEASVAPWYGSAEVVDWWLAELVDHGR